MVRKGLGLTILLLIALAAGCGSSDERVVEPQPTPTVGPVVLHFHRQGGVAGLCDDAAVHAGGVVEYHACGQPVRTATLTLDERQELTDWVEGLRSFTFKEEDNPEGPDNLVRELEFSGQGSAPATEERKREMLAWIEGIYGELAQQPVPGSTASTAGKVIDVVNQQVIVITPDEPGHDLIMVTPETEFKLADGGAASLDAVKPGTHIRVQGTALGAGGLEAVTVIIE